MRLTALLLTAALALGASAAGVSAAGGPAGGPAADAAKKKKKKCPKGKKRAKKGPKKGKCVKKKKKAADARICPYHKRPCIEITSQDGQIKADVNNVRYGSANRLTFPAELARPEGCAPPPSDPLGQAVLQGFPGTGNAEFTVSGDRPGATISGKTSQGGAGTSDGRGVYMDYTVTGSWTDKQTIVGTVTGTQVRTADYGATETDRCSKTLSFTLNKVRLAYAG